MIFVVNVVSSNTGYSKSNVGIRCLFVLASLLFLIYYVVIIFIDVLHLIGRYIVCLFVNNNNNNNTHANVKFLSLSLA